MKCYHDHKNVQTMLKFGENVEYTMTHALQASLVYSVNTSLCYFIGIRLAYSEITFITQKLKQNVVSSLAWSAPEVKHFHGE